MLGLSLRYLNEREVVSVINSVGVVDQTQEVYQFNNNLSRFGFESLTVGQLLGHDPVYEPEKERTTPS